MFPLLRHHVFICAFSQAPGNTIISRQVTPSSIIRQGSPAPTSLAATTTLHRPPILQVTPPVGGMLCCTFCEKIKHLG